MVRHVIIWSLKSDMTPDEKNSAMAKIKEGLEGLIDKIDGLVEISVSTNPLPSSNGDLMLDSLFVDEEALAGYQQNPDHLSVAQFVRSVAETRKCFDYVI